jgi:hypothetical protein
VTRRRRLLATLAAALVAGVAATLGLDAAARTWGNPSAALLIALAAVWLPMTLLTALHTTRPSSYQPRRSSNSGGNSGHGRPLDSHRMPPSPGYGSRWSTGPLTTSRGMPSGNAAQDGRRVPQWSLDTR